MKVKEKIVRWIAPVIGVAIIIFGAVGGAITWSHGDDTGMGMGALIVVCGVITVAIEFSRAFQTMDEVSEELDFVLKDW